MTQQKDYYTAAKATPDSLLQLCSIDGKICFLVLLQKIHTHADYL
jgi:hypothetical protein